MGKLQELVKNGIVGKVLGIGAAALLIVAQIAKWAVSDKEALGHFGVPKGTFAIWTLTCLVVLVGLILGELHKVPVILFNFPLLMSRSGRGGLLFGIGFITCCRNAIVLGLAIPALIVAVLHILLGLKDEPVTLQKAYESTARESNVEMQSKPASQASQPKRNVDIEGFDPTL